MTDPQAHLEADVAALSAALDELRSEIDGLKQHPAAAEIDFSNLDALVARVQQSIPSAPSAADAPASADTSAPSAADAPPADTAPTTAVDNGADTSNPADAQAVEGTGLGAPVQAADPIAAASPESA